MIPFPASKPMKEYYAKRAPEYEHIYFKPERQEDLGRSPGSLKWMT